MANKFPGLARGPIDHNASSVINSISNGVITMGSAVKLAITIPGSEILPRVEELTGTTGAGGVKTPGQPTYGIAVGGDIDGIYGDGTTATTDKNRAANAGEAVVVVTQGRCLARVSAVINVTGAETPPTNKAIVVGDPLVASEQGASAQGGDGPDFTGSVLVALNTTTSTNKQFVIARALQPIVTGGDTDIIAVDIQREGDGTPT